MTALAPPTQTRPTLRVLPLVRRRERPVYGSILAIVAVIAASVSGGLVDYAGDLDDVLAALLMLWICGAAAGACHMAVVESVSKLFCFLLLSGIVASLAGAALATTALPLADRGFLAADRMILGFDIWPGIVSTYPSHRPLLRALAYAYVSISWQPFLLVFVLCWSKRIDAAWRFTAAWTLSLLLCLLVFPWCPGVGAYAHFGLTPHDAPDILVRSAWQYPVTLQSFRNGTAHRLDLDALEGMIAMPSFHACASVLLAWGSRPMGAISIAFAALDTMMWASSVPIGGHYGVDVLAGSLVAAVALHLGSRLTPAPARKATPAPDAAPRS